MTIQKILCPTDFSDGARRALEVATRIAILHRAELVIVHAWELPVYAGGYVIAADVMQSMADDGKRLLDEATALAGDLGAPKVSSRYVTGPAWRAVVDIVTEDTAFDLVVMGTHGRTGLRRVLLGSIAEKVVRLAPCSVLAVHPDDQVDAFRRIVCPTDFSDPAEHAAEIAAQLVDARGATLELVHVVDIPRAAERGPDTLAMARELEERSDAELDRRARRIAAPIQVTCRTKLGHAGEELLALLEAEPYDLVVVGSHGRTGIKLALLGSVAEKLVRHAHCPVLVARIRAK